MEPIDICPPYWPFLLWWHIHHPHGPGPDPGPIDKQLFATLDQHFAAISVTALAGRLGDVKVAREISALGARIASDPMPGLQGLAK
ncbi:MAG: hypothetical protein ABJF01_14445 [bacterium]